jgi:hypothetical protein
MGVKSKGPIPSSDNTMIAQGKGPNSLGRILRKSRPKKWDWLQALTHQGDGIKQGSRKKS